MSYLQYSRKMIGNAILITEQITQINSLIVIDYADTC